MSDVGKERTMVFPRNLETLMDMTAVLLAAAGVSFALTALTVLSVRSEGDKRLVTATFIWTTAVVTGIFYWAELPSDLSYLIGTVV